MKTFLLLNIVFLILVISGCSEEFLEIAPVSNSNVQSFYRNEGDFENAITGAYATLKTNGVYQDYMQLVGDLRSDNTEMGTTASVRFSFFELSEFRDQVTNPINENIWNDHYLGIVRVNEILERIDGLDASESFKNRIKAEAKFLRGLFYFNLVRVFGDVPLVINGLNSIEESYAIGRTDKNEVYVQVISDLDEAENFLPVQAKGEEGRATKGAALALLGKVYLFMHDYESAASKLLEVINLNEYELLDDYLSLWIASNNNHKESIFDVQFKKSSGANTGSFFTERYSPYQFPHLPYFSTSGGYNIPTADLIQAYEEGDLRKEASLREYFIDVSGDTVAGLEGRFNIKFFDMPVQGQGSDDNWPVLRYADVLLMYAEALNEISFQADGDAFYYLNEIRNRAGLPAKTVGNPDPELSVDSQEQFRLAIEHERRVELAFEGHRWFDLVRTGRAIEVLNSKVSGGVNVYQLFLPVPQSQIDINPKAIKQNEGY